MEYITSPTHLLNVNSTPPHHQYEQYMILIQYPEAVNYYEKNV